jgi:hypothetical protein
MSEVPLYGGYGAALWQPTNAKIRLQKSLLNRLEVYIPCLLNHPVVDNSSNHPEVDDPIVLPTCGRRYSRTVWGFLQIRKRTFCPEWAESP